MKLILLLSTLLLAACASTEQHSVPANADRVIYHPDGSIKSYEVERGAPYGSGTDYSK